MRRMDRAGGYSPHGSPVSNKKVTWKDPVEAALASSVS